MTTPRCGSTSHRRSDACWSTWGWARRRTAKGRKDLARRPVVLDTIADRASDLMAASATLAYLRDTRGAQAAEAGRLASRVQGLVAELITLQDDNGGWPWVAPRPTWGGKADERPD